VSRTAERTQGPYMAGVGYFEMLDHALYPMTRVIPSWAGDWRVSVFCRLCRRRFVELPHPSEDHLDEFEQIVFGLRHDCVGEVHT